jgi:DNA-binding beta-propeller fold protein YncE
MRKVLVPAAGLAVVAAVAVGAAQAAPCSPATCAPISVSTPGSNLLFVRSKGLFGPLTAYNLTTGKVGKSLADGALSADGRRYVTGTLEPTGSGAATRITRYDATSGARLGAWLLKAVSGRVAAVSATGRFAAVVQGDEDQLVFVVDLDRRAVLRRVQLSGYWGVDALSRDASRLYLLEYDRAGGYSVRVEVAGTGLLPEPVTDPDETEPMTGFPWSSIATPDGSMQLTLFIKSSENKSAAFIHALSLNSSRAKCIDLQSGGFMAIGRYALVLAPDGRTLYAANPSMGVIDVVDLEKRAVVSTVRFKPTPQDKQTSAAFGAISRDGRTLYFSAGRGLHAYDTRSGVVRAPFRVGAVAGVGIAPSGKTLLVVRSRGTSLRLNAATGARLEA